MIKMKHSDATYRLMDAIEDFPVQALFQRKELLKLLLDIIGSAVTTRMYL